MILADTHTHFYAGEFDADREFLMNEALQKGIQYLFLPNIDRSSIPNMLKLEKQFPNNCFPMIGLHPCSVKEDYEDELSTIEKMLAERKFWGIGEIGIDLYWDKTFFRQQQDAFSRQIRLAKKYNLPYVIHSRNSFDEVMEIITEFKEEKINAIFHCFSGTVEQAERVIALGSLKLGIGGVVTFKNSGLDKVVEAISLEHLVLETDAPYLAPVPFRGKRNEPSYLLMIAQKIAELKNIPLEEVADVTLKNAKAVFNFN